VPFVAVYTPYWSLRKLSERLEMKFGVRRRLQFTLSKNALRCGRFNGKKVGGGKSV